MIKPLVPTVTILSILLSFPSWADGDLKKCPGTPIRKSQARIYAAARIPDFFSSGEIIVGQLGQNNPRVMDFGIPHECGHIKHGRSEQNADCAAGKKLGMARWKPLRPVMAKVFKSKSGSHGSREQRLATVDRCARGGGR